MIEWLSVIVIAFLSLILTALLRKYALARSLIDVPNARSSHSIPTPRGGGVSIVVAFVMALVILAWMGHLSAPALAAIVGSGGLVAVIGFMDDHGHIAARWRLLGHFVAAAWALFWLDGLAPVDVMGWTFTPGPVGQVLAAFYLVWMLNLYNFMDGIDGIAGVEAVTVCMGMSIIYALGGYVGLSWEALLLAVAVAGFLYWNVPPAKIFMGDAGSGFLGIVLGVLSIQGSWASPQLFWSWLILLGVFIVDATVTLVRRMLRRERLYEAHRSHGYQFASRHYGSHLLVTLTVGLINLVWLLPVAMWVALGGGAGLMWTVIAYVPLIFLALRFRAGEAEIT
ncbi:glycosyltransferase family 4 protein [Pseudomonas syringae pv. tagetis]|uniref:Glycosyl transferase, group 4 family protein n=2 Tax=Pseudomonas syringae group genomosp. 7 TaxID=251699 RepID=A0A0N8T2E0_9PSED|nr:glycosyltransferase family 4 protein [Pseudomonas syringae group genomosp. 7]KPX41512.1 Glycosyl transferase, group 4 family protein [Pseudomonas syringae pv. helianthi]KPY82528.1 Glycosyl transferase, group 4 family protein [Pseudomonas syringae pv. tagetis]UNB64756.1 glycosyltransferase family 4 protein [Pseudomonas syringae pv. helianthi]UNB67224.1 glycosyltransferase family 4 protein [Pseudomonas syringae pv. tagetis]